MLKYARSFVEIPLEGNFPDFTEFANEKYVIIRQKVVYEWKPIQCTHCKMFGHTGEDCRNRVPYRQEWRAITTQRATQDQQNQTKEHMQQDEEGF